MPVWAWAVFGVGAILVLLAVGSAFNSGSSSGGGAAQTSSGQAAADATPATPDELIAANQPADETAFLQAVTAARESYQNGANDMAKGASKAQRRAGVCAALAGGLRANNWVGTVTELGANGDGKGILTVQIGDQIVVQTWNNFLSDTMDQTLIDPSSQLFASASSLAKGDPVSFSGQFIPDQVDCAKEASITLEGSMLQPAYVMRFASISKLTSAPAAQPTTADSAAPPATPAPAQADTTTPAPQASTSKIAMRSAHIVRTQPVQDRSDAYVCAHGDHSDGDVIEACDRAHIAASGGG